MLSFMTFIVLQISIFTSALKRACFPVLPTFLTVFTEFTTSSALLAAFGPLAAYEPGTKGNAVAPISHARYAALAQDGFVIKSYALQPIPPMSIIVS
jgi:hypothetical protein